MAIKAEGLVPLLEIFDMPTSLKFYCDMLGFEVVASSGEDWAMLRLGGASLMLNTRYEADDRPSEPDAAAVVAHADTELFIDCPNVDEAYRHLRSLGIEVEPPRVSHYGMKQISVEDPDGFRLWFQHAVQK